jgi:hypothetical protein
VYPVKILDGSKGEALDALLYDQLGPETLFLAQQPWAAERLKIIQELQRHGVPDKQWPESWHWNWLRKASELQLLESRVSGVLLGKEWQGLILTKTASYAARIEGERGRPLVYIDYVETAPWNWKIPSIGQAGRYRAVGAQLFRFAVRQSMEEGFNGRVGLHSLPQAEVFYGRVGMTRLGPDASKHNLVYFEMTPKQADGFLKNSKEV